MTGRVNLPLVRQTTISMNRKCFSNFEAGLAYQSWVNWDPVENTVLANEQVVDGCGWRSGAPVNAVYCPNGFKITEFADDLLAAIDGLDRWPERRIMQANWIGNQTGKVKFQLNNPIDNEITKIECLPPDQIHYSVPRLLP